MRKIVALVAVAVALGGCGGGGDSDSSAEKTTATTAADTATSLPGGFTIPTGLGGATSGGLGDFVGNGATCARIETARQQAERSETTDQTLRDRAKDLRDAADRAKDAAIKKAATDMADAAERADRPAMAVAGDAGRDACKAAAG